MAQKNPRLSANVHLLSKKPQSKRPSDGEPLSEYMWNQTADVRQKALQTYFVQGIGDGTLNPTAFGGYMVQDSVYCKLAKESIDTAAARASQENLKNFLEHESQSYESYYKGLWEKWHIANANGIGLGDACKAYANYENSVATNMETIYFIVALIPCAKLWPWLGQQLQEKKHGVYTDWYKANFDPDGTGYKKLDALVDEAEQFGYINKTQATSVYLECMEGEFAFFDSPKTMY